MGNRKLIQSSVISADEITVLNENSAIELRRKALSGELSENTLNRIREMVEERKTQAAVAIDASNSELAVQLSEFVNLAAEKIIDTGKIDEIMENINTAKDLECFSKALSTLHKLMMDSQINSSDPEKANTKQNMKVSLAFGNGNIAVSVEGGAK